MRRWRCRWSLRLQALKARRQSFRLREKAVRGLLRSRAPSLQARHLVQHLVHQRLESGQLGGDVIHCGYELRLELGGLPRRQSEAAHELVKKNWWKLWWIGS